MVLKESEIKQLLQKLAANEATEAEQRLLDSAADHDEFLKEVLAGYRSAKPNQSANVRELQGRIDARVTQKKERKINPFHWKSIAAAIVLLLGVGIWMVVGSLQTSQDQLTMEVAMEDADLEFPPVSESEEESDDSSPTARTRESNLQKDLPKSESGVSAPATAERAKQAKVSPQVNAAEAQAQASGDQAPDTSTPNYDKVIYLTEGQVFGREDKPLGGATIRLLDHDIKTHSDLQGRFLLPLKKVNGSIEISHPLYVAKSMATVNTMDIASLSLSPKDSKGALSKSSRAQNPAPGTPVPGWRGLARYIGQNLRFPPEAIELNMYASVELTFTVNPDGKPENIKVKNPVGYGFDEEAIRLIADGPKWNPAQDPNEIIYYIVNF